MFSKILQQLIDEEIQELKLSFRKTNDELKRTIAEKDIKLSEQDIKLSEQAKEIENLRRWIKNNKPNSVDFPY